MIFQNISGLLSSPATKERENRDRIGFGGNVSGTLIKNAAAGESKSPLPSRKPDTPKDPPKPPKKPDQKHAEKSTKTSPACGLEYTAWQKALAKVRDLEEEWKKIQDAIAQKRKELKEANLSAAGGATITMGELLLGKRPQKQPGNVVKGEIFTGVKDILFPSKDDRSAFEKELDKTGRLQRQARDLIRLGEEHKARIQTARQEENTQKARYDTCLKGKGRL